MKIVAAKIPDRLDSVMDALVEEGWFEDHDQIIREALRRFLEAHQPRLREQFVRESAKMSSGVFVA